VIHSATLTPPGLAAPTVWLRPTRIIRRRPLRDGVLADFQLICGAGDFEFDILVRELEAPLRLEIGGQVTRAGQVHEPISDLTLVLLEAAEATQITATATDEFGEFEFQSQLLGRYGIRIGEEPDAPCVALWEGDLS